MAYDGKWFSRPSLIWGDFCGLVSICVGLYNVFDGGPVYGYATFGLVWYILKFYEHGYFGGLYDVLKK